MHLYFPRDRRMLRFLVPVALIAGISRWVIYRFREIRVLTLAQFFEVRYSIIPHFHRFSGTSATSTGDGLGKSLDIVIRG